METSGRASYLKDRLVLPEGRGKSCRDESDENEWINDESN